MTALVTAPTDPRELALLKAVGLDRVSPEQRELALHIATRYDLDLMLKHLVLIDGRPYITRDGLLHIAHRSGVLDGIETTDPVLGDDGYWRVACSVYRKDMSRPFTYTGRYPARSAERSHNAKYAPEMATKVGESMSLRRAFDIAAPSVDERWDAHEVPDAPPVPVRMTLADRVAAKAAEVVSEPTTDEDDEPGASTAPVPSGPPRGPAPDSVTSATLTAEVPDTDALTPEQFKEMSEAHRIDPKFATAVRKQVFPAVTSWAEVTDEMRATLMRELLS